MTNKANKANKKNRVIRMLVSMSLVLLMSIGFTGSLFAEFGPITWDTGKEGEPAKAAITKWLRMGESSKPPTARFDFLFAPVSVDGKTGETDKNTMPKIGGDTWTLSANFLSTDQTQMANGIEYIYKEVDILSGIEWPHAGVYVYRVKEVENTYTIVDSFMEDMSYSKAEYDLYVFVKNGLLKPYVYAASAIIRVKDVIHEDEDVGTKVDPTPGGNGKEYFTSQMIFTNDYLKRTPKGVDPDDSALVISKMVDDEHGFVNESMYFTFSITVSNPTILVDANKKYKAFVLDSSDKVVTNADNYAGFLTGPMGAYIEFTTGAPLSVNLKHEQRLSFIDMYVGGYFTVTESAYADFTPKVALTINGITNTRTGSLGAAFTVPETGKAPLGELDNIAAFTNMYKTITPTGIVVDNPPFIAMMIVALGALTGFVALKSRKQRHDDAE